MIMAYTFEEDKKAFKENWGLKIYGDRLRQQLLENYFTPIYGAKDEEDLIAIFGEYDVWNLDCTNQFSL